MLHASGRSISCAIGRSGAIAAVDKREGDGATPLGEYAIRAVLLRPDRVAAPITALPWRWIGKDDGWSDDVADPAYNRPVRHPHSFSAERLWREDGLYDVIVALGHNDAPPVAPLGSAIFLHCRRDCAATEGCVAIAREELVALVAELGPGDTMIIR
ncbi:L,D-peptidoglycan transpeptidase YkuD (ErfK/YbiS/YcfS/YnhG family) [Sphingomonas vulcanisoli]|uniref:L,D-peptidoglycan transpeptidase YkuD (ErfK/YbiS/YcfS/YnhG family) n=1 Tax=Sphingomonas vulcanisoli TaxID=1658060 RepID=A0ABX0TUE0_9SPHN|nr:L,D-transpeptidase family protein [Sphingomonas vulcanisoli]NIJ07390.1 L,D-peptidoglycan transpeptidase YkuD (ErfK/YbiS/YcfS/YnhG family) [Sphingomonas vulcanisoli]